MTSPTRLVRPAIGVAAGLALVAGLASGLARTGVGSGLGSITLHGPLLVLGFFGAVIGAERAVGLGRPWAWMAPGLAALSIAFVVGGADPAVTALATVGSGLALCAVFLVAHRIQPERHLQVMAIGAVSYLGAGVAWALGGAPADLVPWLAGFLVLTIAGERLELARMVRISSAAHRVMLATVAVFVSGAVASLVAGEIGPRVAGAGLLGMAMWLGRYDVARRTVRMSGVTRYMAVALLGGYVWLAISGSIWAIFGLEPGTLVYDAGVHGLFLGFVMSMVFAHAPIVLPSVLGWDLPYRPLLWLPLGLLHASVAVRVAADLAGAQTLRAWAGSANVVAIASFGLIAGWLIVGARSASRDRVITPR